MAILGKEIKDTGHDAGQSLALDDTLQHLQGCGRRHTLCSQPIGPISVNPWVHVGTPMQTSVTDLLRVLKCHLGSCKRNTSFILILICT